MIAGLALLRAGCGTGPAASTSSTSASTTASTSTIETTTSTAEPITLTLAVEIDLANRISGVLPEFYGRHPDITVDLMPATHYDIA